MVVKRGYVAELDLNNEQITACLKHVGATRFAYNYALTRKRENCQAGLKTPYAAELHREINVLKQTEIPWAYEVSKCAFQERGEVARQVWLSQIQVSQKGDRKRTLHWLYSCVP